MSLAISGVIAITISVAAATPTAPTFNTGRVLTKSVLPYYDRVREYGDEDEVLVDFASNSEVFKAAQEYFGQTPSPDVFQVGRMFAAAQSGVLKGGAVSSVYTTFTGINNGGFDVTINGVLKQITAVDFSAQTSMAGLATVLQTKLAAAVAGTTCVWNSQLNCFVASPAASTGTGSTISFAAAPTGGGSPVDISATLGFTNATGAKSIAGCAAEAATDAASACGVVSPNYFAAAATTEFTTQENKDLMAYFEAAKRKFFCTHSDGNVLSTGNTTNLSYYAKNLGYRWTYTQYSSTNNYAAVSAMARELIVNYDQPKAAITLKFKKEPGVAVENITSTQAAAIKTYNCNVYVDRGGFPMIEEGVMADGTFSDEVTGLAWYQGQLETEYFGVLAAAPAKVAQTDEGVQKLVKALNRANQKAVNAGLLAPGVWQGDGVGAKVTGDFLEDGYYTYAQPVAEQSPSDRTARIAPPITILACGAGAIHSGAVQVNFQR